jgi:pyruvate dehydrogenase E1 component beta subunit
VTKGLYEEFGEERVRDTPIAEGVIAGAAMGAAVGGQRPVAEIMTINFALLTLDQMANHAAKMHHMFGGQWSVPMVLRMAAGETTLNRALTNAGSVVRARHGSEACSKRRFAISIR